MKKFILAAVAASLISVPAMAAPQSYRHAPAPQHATARDDHRGYDRNRGYDRAPQRNQYRNWHRGERFDARQARNYRQIDYRQYRGLNAPPRGYRYVQSGNDALLVGITSGIVAAVIANLIN